MCEAIEVLMNRRETEGIQLGMAQGKLSILKDLVDDGTLTVEVAAGKVNMSVKEFEEYMKKNYKSGYLGTDTLCSVAVPIIIR